MKNVKIKVISNIIIIVIINSLTHKMGGYWVSWKISMGFYVNSLKSLNLIISTLV